MPTGVSSYAGARSKSGVYTGDGNATQVISGLPFAPKYVVIYANAGAIIWGMTIKNTNSDEGIGVEDSGTTITLANYYITLGTNGFTATLTPIDVNSFNNLGTVYYFFAVE